VWCKQTKPCGILSWQECCVCFYQGENEKAQQYTNYQQVYSQKVQDQQNWVQQLKLLRNYAGCPKCESPEIAAYELYDHNQLVCQSCLVQKTGQSSSPISFAEQSR